MNIILVLFLCLACSYLFARLCKKLGLPKILGPVAVGILFGIAAFRPIMFPDDIMTTIEGFRDLALIFMMFFVGLKIDLKDFKKASRRSIVISSLSVLIPLVFGFFMTLFMFKLGMLEGIIDSQTNIYFVAFFVGITLSLTAETVAVQVLEELNLLRTIVGETIIEAAIIDDIIGILLITGLVAISPTAGQSSSLLSSIGIKFLQMLIFVVFLYMLAKFIIPVIMKMAEREKSRTEFFGVAIMITLFLALVTQYLDLGGSILGALFSGFIIRATLLSGDKYEKREEKDITYIIEIFTFSFLAPFFFIWVGLNTNISVLVNPLFTVMLIAVALAGKIIGSVIGNRISGGTMQEGIVIGWGMNAKFDVELLIATIVLAHGYITQNLFSTLVFVSLVCTVLSAIVFKIIVKKHHGLS